MHRCIVAALLLLSCITPKGGPYFSPEGLELSREKDVAQFFEAHLGSVKNCPKCVPFEEIEDTIRTAYFIETVESCRLTHQDIEGFTEGDTGSDNSFVYLRLNESGEAQRRRCIQPNELDPESRIRMYLIVVNGRSTGIELLFSGDRDGEGIFLYGTVARAVAPVLRSSGGLRSGQ